MGARFSLPFLKFSDKMKRKLDCVLLIDDDEPTNFLNKMIIEETGFVNEVKVTQSALEALDYSGWQTTNGSRR